MHLRKEREINMGLIKKSIVGYVLYKAWQNPEIRQTISKTAAVASKTIGRGMQTAGEYIEKTGNSESKPSIIDSLLNRIK